MSYVTALPSSPVDGQEIYFGADPTNSVIWRLRYRAAKSGSYKWEYLGGAPMAATADTSRAPTNTGDWYGLVTDGASPSLTVPLAGIYDVTWGAELFTPTSAYIYMGVNYSDAGTWSSILAGSSAGYNRYETLMKEARTPGAVAAGATLACYYFANSVSTAAAFRYLRLRPVAVG